MGMPGADILDDDASTSRNGLQDVSLATYQRACYARCAILTQRVVLSGYTSATQCGPMRVPERKDKHPTQKDVTETGCAVSLGAPYAMSGTDIAYGTTANPLRLPRVKSEPLQVHNAMKLRTPYALSGANVAYASRPPRSRSRRVQGEAGTGLRNQI
eukprot:3458669-Rhodomonas_salina.1